MKLKPLSRVCVSAAEDRPHSIPPEVVVSSRRQRDDSGKSPAIHSAWQTQALVAKKKRKESKHKRRVKESVAAAYQKAGHAMMGR
jgi:hypothetical protein